MSALEFLLVFWCARSSTITDNLNAEHSNACLTYFCMTAWFQSVNSSCLHTEASEGTAFMEFRWQTSTKNIYSRVHCCSPTVSIRMGYRNATFVSLPSGNHKHSQPKYKGEILKLLINHQVVWSTSNSVDGRMNGWME